MTDHSQLVKPLEWRRFDRDRELSETSFGSYLTDGLKGSYTVEFRGVLFNGAPHQTLDAAKAAAQADYTARILSALNPDAIDTLQARVEALEAGLRCALDAVNRGRMIERGAGGMSIEAQLQRSFYNDVPAWPFEEARALLERNPS